ncbi:hypothetical protein [Clostridium sp.]|uniref:hypothetical protein n=1 Tax=Clostridium sp. TaxID=1506 RepID=UPI0032174CC4
MKVTMILGMSKLKAKLKYEAEGLRDSLESFVFSEYIKGNESALHKIDIKKMDNDLGYISIAVYEEEDKNILSEYKNLLNNYSKQLGLPHIRF